MVRSLVVILTFLISPRASSVKSSLDNAGLRSQPGLFRLSRSSKLEGGDVLALERREERFRRLSFVGQSELELPDRDKSMEPSDVSDREEGLRRVVGRKRFKLPGKVCNAIR